MADKTVCIAVPSTTTVYADFAFSLTGMILHSITKSIPILAMVNRKGSIIAQNRCALVEEAKNSKATHILFLDSDHIVPVNLLSKLLEDDKDIVGVHQVTKVHPCRSNCEDLKGNRLTKPGEGLQEVSRLGTGIMLISMKVFEHMKRPYFNTIYKDGMMDKIKGWHGEDYYFCERARHAGYSIWVDHDISKEVYHIGVANYGLEELNANTNA